MVSSQDVILEPSVNTSTQIVASRINTHLQGRKERGGEEAVSAGRPLSAPKTKQIPDGYRASVTDDEKVLEMHSDDKCASLVIN